MRPAAKITVTPSINKLELEAQIQAEKDKFLQAAEGVEKETALKNYHYLNSFYHSNILRKPYERKAPFNTL